ncbi:Tyrosine-type recombinase/integrase [Sulfidibacter corallicola]|uniref:Tyrosine-type recombinase/integrase n=1 Tax=Sulfidibacter corallicola TaxID=2818388 RepID=A0A8A4TGA8_SULCO|nr:tyrosine-type recombinase/integrase [Sulfidibacter corallicola]QTD48557.1 tyrosine-type recombinase/integrase [Sulfidibacter corallicola]
MGQLCGLCRKKEEPIPDCSSVEPIEKGQINGKPNPNHPKKGSSIKVSPIKDKTAIKAIKDFLAGRPRDLCFFTLGINTAFRANELLSIKIYQVRRLRPGDDFELKLPKTKTYRRVTANRAVVNAIQNLLKSGHFEDEDWLFKSKTTNEPLKVSTVSKYVKNWCQKAGLAGNYASHSLRKTWGYWQRVGKDVPIPLLMVAFGHSNQSQTLQYLCIQSEEIAGIYMGLEL